MADIRFNKRTVLHLVDAFDERKDKITAEHDETFEAGTVCEVDLMNKDHGHYDVQFGNGSVAFHVFQEAFEIL